jgi:hypothetical protein
MIFLGIKQISRVNFALIITFQLNFSVLLTVCTALTINRKFRGLCVKHPKTQNTLRRTRGYFPELRGLKRKRFSWKGINRPRQSDGESRAQISTGTQLVSFDLYTTLQIHPIDSIGRRTLLRPKWYHPSNPDRRPCDLRIWPHLPLSNLSRTSPVLRCD